MKDIPENGKLIIIVISSLLPLLNTVFAIGATVALVMDICAYLKHLFIVRAHNRRMKRLFGDSFYDEDDDEGEYDYEESDNLLSDESYDERDNTKDKK